MEALKLFSVYGFEGVSIKKIADAVGIKDSSLYKHFARKQEIFDTLLTVMNQRFEAQVTYARLPQGEIKDMAVLYGENDLSWLRKACESIFLFFLKDPYASRFRRMLMIEQYKNSEAAKILDSWLMGDALDFQAALFTEMMELGYFKKVSPQMAAIHFYSPIYFLLCRYDNKPDKEAEALAILSEHVDQFAENYQLHPKEAGL